MRPYEVVVIFDAELEEEQVKAVLDRSVETVRSGGGTPGRIERWGRRRFAYELNKKTEGTYVLVEATAEPAAMAVLDRQLTLTDGVLRHKVIRVPDHVAGRERRSLPPQLSVEEEAAAASEERGGRRERPDRGDRDRDRRNS